MYISEMKRYGLSSFFLTAVLFWAAVFTFLSAAAQSDSVITKPKSYFGAGLITSFFPFRTPAYPEGRLKLKLHNSPSPEFYFMAGFPIGKKGFGVELFASAGILFFRESFTVDSVFVNDEWRDDSFKRLRMGESFFGRFSVQGFWQKKLTDVPLLLGISAGIGTTLYMPTTLTGLGVDYSFSPNPVDINFVHEVRINTPDGGPHLFVPLAVRASYIFPGSHTLTFTLRAGFSHQDLLNSRYVYLRPGYSEFQSSVTRDISFGLGLGYSYPFRPHKKR
jgi:hypothetical protein